MIMLCGSCSGAVSGKHNYSTLALKKRLSRRLSAAAAIRCLTFLAQLQQLLHVLGEHRRVDVACCELACLPDPSHQDLHLYA